MQTSFEPLEKALQSLKNALNPAPLNDRERDGAIQRFEYTFELSWKAAKRVLLENGIDSRAPKTVIRDLAQQGWIEDAELWLEFLKARNATSHSYQEEVAENVFDHAKKFTKECEKLISILKKNSK